MLASARGQRPAGKGGARLQDARPGGCQTGYSTNSPGRHMNSKPIVSAIAALSLGLTGFAGAQQDKDRRADEAGRIQRLPARQQQQLQRQELRQMQGHNQGWDRGRHDSDRPPARQWDRGGRGAGPDHNFYRGGRLPPAYRDRVYVVDDWRGHHLRQPPRGYHWVQTGTDYVLVAIATGIIASILLNQ